MRSTTSTTKPFLAKPVRKPRTVCGAQPIASATASAGAFRTAQHGPALSFASSTAAPSKDRMGVDAAELAASGEASAAGPRARAVSNVDVRSVGVRRMLGFQVCDRQRVSPPTRTSADHDGAICALNRGTAKPITWSFHFLLLGYSRPQAGWDVPLREGWSAPGRHGPVVRRGAD